MQLFGLYVPVTMQRQAPAVPLRWRAPDPVHRQWLDIPVMRAETCTHSANCADDRRDFPGAVLGPGADMPVVVQRHMHSSRVSRSSTSLSWRRGCPLGLTVQITIEISQLQYIDKVIDVTVVQVQQIPRVLSVKIAEIPQLHSFVLGQGR